MYVIISLKILQINLSTISKTFTKPEIIVKKNKKAIRQPGLEQTNSYMINLLYHYETYDVKMTTCSNQIKFNVNVISI